MNQHAVFSLEVKFGFCPVKNMQIFRLIATGYALPFTPISIEITQPSLPGSGAH